jgi:hypothetical protein
MDKTTDAKRVVTRWVPFITTRDGRKIWAKSYGYRAFPITVTVDR